MAAYAAATSLKTTIKRILQSSRISLIPPSSHMLQFPCNEMEFLQRLLAKLDDTGCSKIRTEVNAWDERIKEIVWGFEDVLESHVVDQIIPQLESSGGDLSFSVDLRSLPGYIDSFIKILTMMEKEYLTELVNMPEEEGEPISSRIDFGGIDSNMVGLSEEFEQVRDYLLAENENCLAITGMAGVGKTMFAKKIFDDPLIQGHFELRVWVKVGRKCEFNEALRSILAQVDPDTYKNMLTQGEDDDDNKLFRLLGETFKEKRCLIVLDDVWMTKTGHAFPNFQIVITSRINTRYYNTYILRLLNKEESLELLAQKVFGEEGFPPQLYELGKKIADKCEGLPLLIVKVAERLSKANKSPKYWTEVAEKQHSKVSEDAFKQISKVLSPSYEYLPQHLKMPFLYLGAYCPYSKINKYELIHQLAAEGFLDQIREQTFETFEDLWDHCMSELSMYNLLLLRPAQLSSLFQFPWLRVHCCWLYFCKEEASKIKFFHVLQTCGKDDINGQRRLSAHCNTLFGFKEVYGSIKSDCASTTRSLLCFGPYHQYPMSIESMGFKLLRVLDADGVRLYHFPLEILKLICLHYLALSCDEELPPSISKLFQLQFLSLHRYMFIKKRDVHSYMPVEIWDMQELQHIEVSRSDLPTPTSDATLNKLSSLFGVSAKSCTKEILKRIPNLLELRIQAELKPYDDDADSNPFSGLGYISEELQNLKLLTSHVVNPDLKYECMLSLSMFPSRLEQLELSGLGCPWQHMNDIGSQLPNLQCLGLLHYAFRGPNWDIDSGCFLKLRTLTIEDTDLVRWRPQPGSFPELTSISMRYCYKLRQLDWTCTDHSLETTIELINCIPSAIASTNLTRSESGHVKVRQEFSFFDKKSSLYSPLGSQVNDREEWIRCCVIP